MNDHLTMCPMCEMFPAMLGRSTWGHDALCCSDTCGLAFGSTAKYAEHRLNEAKIRLHAAQDSVKYWQSEWDSRSKNETVPLPPIGSGQPDLSVALHEARELQRRLGLEGPARSAGAGIRDTWAMMDPLAWKR